MMIGIVRIVVPFKALTLEILMYQRPSICYRNASLMGYPKTGNPPIRIPVLEKGQIQIMSGLRVVARKIDILQFSWSAV